MLLENESVFADPLKVVYLKCLLKVKNLFVYGLFYLICINAFSQNTLNNDLKCFVEVSIKPTKSVELLVELDNSETLKLSPSKNYALLYSYGNLAKISISVSKIYQLLKDSNISYIEYQPAPKLVKSPLCDTFLVRNKLKSIQFGEKPLSRAYTGKNVLIGIIDTGVDITHPDFKDEQGKSRIKYIWDQNVETGNRSPAPFNYGTEWDSGDINVGQCLHKDKNGNGHGTFVAGIASANAYKTKMNQGCAPNANLIIVSYNFKKGGPTTADAVKYILDKAELLGMPVVINASFGNYAGSHDASSLETKLIEYMIKDRPGCCLVAAAGNSGDHKQHVKYRSSKNDSAFTWIKSTGKELELRAYGDSQNVSSLQYAIAIDKPDFLPLGRTKFKTYNYALKEVKNDTIYNNGKIVAVLKSSASINPYGVYELYLKIRSNAPEFLCRLDLKGKGELDIWDFNLVSNDLPDPKKYPSMKNYLWPNSNSSIVSGIQCSKEVITVGSYVNTSSFYDVKGNLQQLEFITDALVTNSSMGPTRDGIIKPDIVACGQNVISCRDQSLIESHNPEYKLSNADYYMMGGGTSAASAIVAGWAALYLEQYPKATNTQIKEALIKTAFKDAYTGNNLPNNKCGYGKMDGFKAFIYPFGSK